MRIVLYSSFKLINGKEISDIIQNSQFKKNNLLFGKYIDNKQVIKSKQYNLHKLHRDAEDYFLKIVFVRLCAPEATV